jgi:hypothetical protein
MKIAQELMLPAMFAAIFVALLLAESPAVARGNHGGHHGGNRGHHAGGHARSHFSTLPATSYAGVYCASFNRRVRDARECPEMNTQSSPEAPAPFTYRENR